MMFAFEVSLKLSDKGTTFYLLRVIMGKILLLVENVHVFFPSRRDVISC